MKGNKIMKLLPMTDFVLENNKLPYIEGTKYKDIINYANFLKQPLKLEMFVPCDEENVLIKPSLYDPRSKTGNTNREDFKECEIQYNKAKEKVLFEGFEPKMFRIEDNGAIVFNSNKWKSVWAIGNKTIEEVTYLNCNLTPSAIKQFGL